MTEAERVFLEAATKVRYAADLAELMPLVRAVQRERCSPELIERIKQATVMKRNAEAALEKAMRELPGCDRYDLLTEMMMSEELGFK